MKTSKNAKTFLKKTRSKHIVSQTSHDKELHTFLNAGGRQGVRKDFFSLLKRAVKASTS